MTSLSIEFRLYIFLRLQSQVDALKQELDRTGSNIGSLTAATGFFFLFLFFFLSLCSFELLIFLCLDAECFIVNLEFFTLV